MRQYDLFWSGCQEQPSYLPARISRKPLLVPATANVLTTFWSRLCTLCIHFTLVCSLDKLCIICHSRLQTSAIFFICTLLFCRLSWLMYTSWSDVYRIIHNLLSRRRDRTSWPYVCSRAPPIPESVSSTLSGTPRSSPPLMQQ